MIYLITGVPGSGKTLYAVSTLLRKLAAEKIKGPDGEIDRRLVIDGIPNLLLPHELMASPKADLLERNGKGEPTADQEGHGLWNWWTWCQPGDILVVDEVQRYWRPRGIGTKPPEDVAKLEVHRHFGVDLVLITQNPMLLDQNVRRLVGRHLHVRRLFGTARALIYDWDGCQTDTSRLGGATRTLWSYPRDAFTLYKSSELHTKQRQKVPLWLGFPVVVLALGAFAGPKAYSALHGSMTGKGISSPVPSSPVPAASAPASAPSPSAQVAASSPLASGGAAAPAVAARVRYLGCVVSSAHCRCYDADGFVADLAASQCRTEASSLALSVSVASTGSAVQTNQPRQLVSTSSAVSPSSPVTPSDSDNDLTAWARSREVSQR